MDATYAVGYVCELPAATPPLSVDAQRAAVLAACAVLDVQAEVPFHDRAADGRPELVRLLARLHQRLDTPAVVVIADPAVLGEGVRAQWTRALQVAALGADLRVAGGRAPDAALADAWAAGDDADWRRERTLEGMRRRALRGEPLGRAPYGYRVERADGVRAGRARLVPDPAEAEMVRAIFAMYLEQGEGVRRIAARLNADGVRTRRGGAWNLASVRDLLRNPVYTGLYRRLGVSIAGAHAALVSAADFRTAQRRMAARRSPAAGSGERRRRDYALSGIARCGYCGAGLVGASRSTAGGREHRSYRCGAAIAQGRCRARTRHADDLEDAVLDAIAQGVEREPVLEPARGTGGSGARIARMRGLQRELDRMIERRGSGQWTAEQLARNSASPALELLRLELGAGRPWAAAEPVPGSSMEAARHRLLEDWASLDQPERRGRLTELVREIVVTDDAVRVALVPVPGAAGSK